LDSQKFPMNDIERMVRKVKNWGFDVEAKLQGLLYDYLNLRNDDLFLTGYNSIMKPICKRGGVVA
jgi:hypothetical protein